MANKRCISLVRKRFLLIGLGLATVACNPIDADETGPATSDVAAEVTAAPVDPTQPAEMPAEENPPPIENPDEASPANAEREFSTDFSRHTIPVDTRTASLCSVSKSDPSLVWVLARMARPWYGNCSSLVGGKLLASLVQFISYAFGMGVILVAVTVVSALFQDSVARRLRQTLPP